MSLRFGNTSLRASLRNISSPKSKDVSASLPMATPPARQLTPEQVQLTSLAASASLHVSPLFAAKRGEMTMVSASAFPRKAAATAVRK